MSIDKICKMMNNLDINDNNNYDGDDEIMENEIINDEYSNNVINYYRENKWECNYLTSESEIIAKKNYYKDRYIKILIDESLPFKYHIRKNISDIANSCNCIPYIAKVINNNIFMFKIMCDNQYSAQYEGLIYVKQY